MWQSRDAPTDLALALNNGARSEGYGHASIESLKANSSDHAATDNGNICKDTQANGDGFIVVTKTQPFWYIREKSERTSPRIAQISKGTTSSSMRLDSMENFNFDEDHGMGMQESIFCAAAPFFTRCSLEYPSHDFLSVCFFSKCHLSHGKNFYYMRILGDTKGSLHYMQNQASTRLQHGGAYTSRFKAYFLWFFDDMNGTYCGDGGNLFCYEASCYGIIFCVYASVLSFATQTYINNLSFLYFILGYVFNNKHARGSSSNGSHLKP